MSPRPRSRPLQCFRLGQGFAVDDGIHRSTPVESCGKVTLSKRRDRLVDDPVAHEIGERALEATADSMRSALSSFATRAARRRRAFFAASFQASTTRIEYCSHLLRLRGCNDQDRDLRAFARLECCESVFDGRALSAVSVPVRSVDARLERRNRLRSWRRRRKRRREKQRRPSHRGEAQPRNTSASRLSPIKSRAASPAHRPAVREPY